MNIGLTLGDPAGIGPEIVAKEMSVRPSPDQSWVVIGCAWALHDIATQLDIHLPAYNLIETVTEARQGWNLLDTDQPRPPDFALGQIQASCGECAVSAVTTAAQLCLAGELAAMVTAPIHKEALQAAGYVNDIGHQEILARLAGTTNNATMLMTPGLRVVHLSTHKSLAAAVQFVTFDNVLRKLKLIQESFQRWGVSRPRIAVAALNPHGGEGGLLGREELDELLPAVAKAQALGMDASGPWPADSVFNRAIAGEFDVVLALYHDQGHIAIKVHNFHASTTVTMGLPILRTSVDHGTAFDIAGQGIADAAGLRAAMQAALALLNGDIAAA
ncbi:MAG: 4-hydroxythreonine-4-phosphate dehydrogenase PdxA [SAR116 cluster bacterium]|nr:MAG: 4-hydroxythreonine-4-phosphate dehydrogenase PdxA [SAR116 cluster bacterium]HCD26831.1 4-hydroxythreonine-4-phosphate dehydrogenase PdxA [Gammaproteobacteria bacterium]|tara:strand:- start:199 stop:1188 length:990 start_codon:yes stop_codon:yes gene_type:complete